MYIYIYIYTSLFRCRIYCAAHDFPVVTWLSAPFHDDLKYTWVSLKSKGWWETFLFLKDVWWWYYVSHTLAVPLISRPLSFVEDFLLSELLTFCRLPLELVGRTKSPTVIVKKLIRNRSSPWWWWGSCCRALCPTTILFRTVKS